MKRVSEYDVTPHGIHDPQYFQGHGIALTRWEAYATGAGNDPREALDDALEQLAQQGWEVGQMEGDILEQYPDYANPEKVASNAVGADDPEPEIEDFGDVDDPDDDGEVTERWEVAHQQWESDRQNDERMWYVSIDVR